MIRQISYLICLFITIPFSNLWGNNCLNEVTRGCRYTPNCTKDDYEKNKQVLFVDVNFSYCEVPKLDVILKKDVKNLQWFPK